MQQAAEYRKTEVNTSDRVRIVSLLYDGAINFVRMAKNKLDEGDLAAKGLYTGKATAIVGELSSTLDVKAGGEIGQNLRRLYDFVMDRLFYANMRNDRTAFEDAERVLDVLRGAWKEMAESNSEAGSRRELNGTGMELRV